MVREKIKLRRISSNPKAWGSTPLNEIAIVRERQRGDQIVFPEKIEIGVQSTSTELWKIRFNVFNQNEDLYRKQHIKAQSYDSVSLPFTCPGLLPTSSLLPLFLFTQKKIPSQLSAVVVTSGTKNDTYCLRTQPGKLYLSGTLLFVTRVSKEVKNVDYS